MDVSKSIYHIQIMIKMPDPSETPTASFKAQNQDSKGIDVLCTFKTKIESQNLALSCIKDQSLYESQNQDA